MVRSLFERGQQAQGLVGIGTASHGFTDQRRPAVRERAGLVEDRGAHLRQRLQRGAALHENARARRPRNPSDEGDGGGQDQRAWRCDDQNGKAADRIARDVPGNGRDNEGDGQQHQGEAVGHADEGRLDVLRRGDHAHDTGIGALLGQRPGAHGEGLPRIDRAAAHRIAGPALHRERLAGHCRFVDAGGRVEHGAIHRQHLAGAHDQHVADAHFTHGNGVEARIGAPVRDARRAVGQRLEVALGAAARKILQHGSTGIHDRDDDGRQRLVEQQRGTHRHERDGIHAEPADPEITQDRNRQHGNDGDAACSPKRVRRDREPGDREIAGARHRKTARQAGNRNGKQQFAQDRFEQGAVFQLSRAECTGKCGAQSRQCAVKPQPAALRANPGGQEQRKTYVARPGVALIQDKEHASSPRHCGCA